MPPVVLRTVAGIGLLALSAACGSSGPTSPTATSVPPVVVIDIPPPSSRFPPLTGPSRTFSINLELSNRVSEYTRQSRFVLYDNGAFVLQYFGLGGEYRGRYTEENGVITFEWEGWSSAGSWGATGTIKGNTLAVQYNLIMWLTDFEDATYTQTQ